jgi:hypothetical protein
LINLRKTNQFDPFQSTDLPSSNPLPDRDPDLDLVLAPELASPEPLAPPPLAIYPTREALEAIQSWSKSRGYAFIAQQSARTGSERQRITYAGDRWLSAESRSQGIRSTQSRGTACPFSILGVEAPNSPGWEIIRYRAEAKYNTHNHPPSSSPAAHPSYRHLSVDIRNTAQDLFEAAIQPRQTITFIRQIAPESPLLPPDIYNQNALFCRETRQGLSPTEALVQHLQDKDILQEILNEETTNRLLGLWIARPESIQYLQSHHDVLTSGPARMMRPTFWPRI